MKKILTLVAGLFIFLAGYAQAPTQINYQGVARKANGHAVANNNISLRLTIHDGSAAGTTVYSETRALTTNAYGLFNVAIGSPGATAVTGSIASVNWAVGSKFLQVELDPDGGTSFTNLGSTQLLSVPYSLYSAAAPPVGNAGGDLTGTYPNPTVAKIRGVNVTTVAPTTNYVLGYNGSSWTPVSLATHPDNYWRLSGSNIYNANAANVGVGTTTPAEKLDVNGNLRTLGFIMPTGAGPGKVLTSDAGGTGTWSSMITATSLVLPYKDSAASTTAHIFHIIQTSPTSTTGALWGVTRSTAANAFGTGGLVSDLNPGALSAGVRGENRGTGANGVGVYGTQNGTGAGVYGVTNAGVGVRGVSDTHYGVYGSSNTSTGVFGLSTATTGYLAGVFGYATFYGGNGTFGYATKALGFGAIGVSDSSTGVYALSNAANFSATSNDGAAVYALATRGATGVFSNSSTGIAGHFQNTYTGNTNNVMEITTNGLGRNGFLQNTNASNNATTLEVNSNGLGRAILARSNLPGFAYSGVIDGATSVVGGNAIFGRGTRPGGWGVFGFSDSSNGVSGIGYRPGSIGVFGQSFQGTAGSFVIDGSFPNTSNTVEVSNSQSGNGVVVNLANAANGIDISQAGSGLGLVSNSSLGIAGRFENTNPTNTSTTLDVNSNGLGRAIVARSQFGGFVNAGVVDALTTTFGGNALYGRATRAGGWGVYGLSDSSAGVSGIGIRSTSVGVQGQGYQGPAGRFLIDGSFVNTSNALEVSNTQSGNGVLVTVSNTANGVEIAQNGNGLGLLSNSNTGIAGRFENTNATNNSTTLDVVSNGTGRAIVARSQFPGYVNAGVIDGLSTTFGGNAVYGRATRFGGWGIYGLSDSSAGVSGIGYRAGSTGVQGQGWMGSAGTFFIDNSFVNNSNVLDVSTTQQGNGISVNVTNAARGINITQAGTGIGIAANSHLGNAASFTNTNASNNTPVVQLLSNSNGQGINAQLTNAGSSNATIYSETMGFGNALYGVSDKGNAVMGISNNGGLGSAGVYGLNYSTGGNGVIGWATQANDWGLAAHSDISIGVYAESITGNAGYFVNGGGSAVPSVYAQTNGSSNAASFYVSNASNTADAVTISRQGAGRSLFVDGYASNNLMNFYNPAGTGFATSRFEGRAGIAVLGHSSGSFLHSLGGRVGVGVYGVADSVGSTFNYGVVGIGRGGSLENAGIVGFLDNGSASSVNAGVYGVDLTGTHLAGLFQGNVQVTGFLSKGGGSFKIDHPQDPENKFLVHSFVESPDMMNVYNGNITTDASGKAVVSLPGYFEAENIDFKYQLTVIGQFAQAIIGEEVKENQFVILTDKPGVKVSWQVTGVRNDKFAQKNRVVPELEKNNEEKGKYLYPELYGKPKETGITYLKTGLPSYQPDNETSKTVAVNNAAQEVVNKNVTDKMAGIADPTTLAKPIQAKTTAIEQEQKPVQVPNQKSQLMIKDLNTAQPEPQPVAKKIVQPVTTQVDKAKQLSTSLDVKNEPSQQPEKTNAPNNKPVQNDKATQLGKNIPVTEQTAPVENKPLVTPTEQKKLNGATIKLPQELSKDTPKNN
jgi:ribosome maturation factor RimP